MLALKAAEEETSAKATASPMLCTMEYRRILGEKGCLTTLIYWFGMLTFARMLLSVSLSESCRSKANGESGGACGLLQSPAGMEVVVAKRLLESLGRGKLWSVSENSTKVEGFDSKISYRFICTR